MGVVQQGQVDGVPAFWVDTGRPTLSASLVFRQGVVDETLATTGWNHLLEHLALHGRASGPLHVNGAVTLQHTRLDLHGPPERVVAELASLSRWLGDPSVGELAREQSVLRAEAAVRGRGEVGMGLIWRYGAGGPGLSGYAEPGLPRADGAAVRALAARAFTSGNAALFLDGPPPSDMAVHLPEGALRPVPVAQPCDDTLPAAYLIGSGITLSGAVRRTVAATVLPHVLREMLTAELRETEGGAYAPWGHYEPVDDRTAVVFAGSDANEVLLRTVADRGLALVARVARGDFDTTVVGDTVDQMLQAVNDPYNLPGLAYRAVLDHLRGDPVVDLEETLEEYRAVDVAGVVEAAAAMHASLMLGIDREAHWDKQLPMLGMPTDDPRLPGRRHGSRNFPAHRDTLVVAADAVQVGRTGFATVRLEDVVGLFAYPDGCREVVARDGWSIGIEPTLWRGGEDAVRAVDSMVPQELHLPMLARDASQVPQPLSAWRRLRHFGSEHRRGLGRGVLALLVVLVVGVVVTLAVTTGRVPWGGIIGGLGFAVWSFLRERRRT